ncbi:hypothetical protein [Turneriella parva]|uniref:Uncharacterized protein n=1 Tax=Turneriella parva (strain ATCC BAA-1111 / DSM 21527 / NCTC 11395 / H) TaxID=869212 RepID=I4B1N8_TURPD|nr:hypothetical protein [Turneriella parva]AFM11195.1 hypothetical protein Turpa_0541 [Turneriella parva DSM 21527]
MKTLFHGFDLTRVLHRASAVVLLIFILPHIANHLMALTGIETHIAAMRQLRAVYRFAAVEVLLLAAALLQVVTGLVLAYHGRHKRLGFWPRLQTWSGIAIATFLLQHVPAVMVGRYLQQLDTNFYFAAAVLQGGLHKYYFFPYYFLGLTAVFVHLAAALRLRMQPGFARTLAVCTLFVTGMGAAVLILLCFGGALYEVRLPAGYKFL